MSNFKQPNIAIIGAVVFLYVSKLLGSSNFELYLCFSDIQANSAKLAEASDLSNVPFEYHEFANVFSKTKAEVLTSYHSYDLKINLEEDAQPLVGPIYSYWIPNAQLIVETDVSDYVLIAILSIVNKENKVYLVAFHFCTFTVVELNYNMQDKELLAIFEAFKIWQHYLEGLAYPIDVVMDYKNLEYFSTTKVLTQRQA